ncbi:hypothetical protein Zmor_028284 [Zophobas morio]|uniref:DDE-1 domain-containing protein n=1 Tax=Zophobas morio TaxID=2755281 RepID=A0AA38M3C2_9CUCU|nr:hypothetical protein Zmor_028284 [Zophobas morio]
MHEWFEQVWKKRRSTFFEKRRKSQCLIIYDSCRAHLTEEIKTLVQQHTELAVIPGGLTKALQPLDVAINKSFKDKLRVLWDEWIMNEALATFTPAGNRRRPSLVTVCEWIVTAWRDVSPDTVKKGFEKAGLHSYQNEEIHVEISDGVLEENNNHILDTQNEIDGDVESDTDVEDGENIESDSENYSDNELIGDEFDEWEDVAIDEI